MDPELQLMLEAADTRAVNEFQSVVRTSPYAELADEHTDERGFIKLFATAEGSQFQRFRGKAAASMGTERGMKIVADLFTVSKMIPRQKWTQLKAWLGNNWAAWMGNIAAKAQARTDQLYTSLIGDAVAGTAVANLYDDSVVFGSITIPGSGAGGPVTTINNRLTGGALSETTLRDAYHAVYERLAAHTFADKTPFFDPGDVAKGLRIMHPMTGKLKKLLDKVFDTGATTSRDVVDKITGVMPKPNPYWNQDSRLNGSGATGGVLFYYPSMTNLKLLQKVQRTGGIDELQRDFPNTESDNAIVPQSQQQNQMYMATALKYMEVGVGSPIQGIWVDFTNIR